MPLAPRVLLIMADQWLRASLRAALREVGYDAVGSRGMAEATKCKRVVFARGAVELLIIDQDVLELKEASSLQGLIRAHDEPQVLLLSHAVLEPPPGSWSQILRRPMTVADIVAAVQALLPLAKECRRPLLDA
jgi:hypothetical protein